MHSISALAVLCVSLARLAAAANATIGYYSLLTTTYTGPPIPSYVISDSVAGIASVSVQPDGETVYAETIVVTLDALVNGTSTITNALSAPTTLVFTFAEDASRYSQSQADIVTLPESGGVVSAGIQMECTGATGAQATCVNVVVQSAGDGVVSRTQTFSAVRLPAATITSGGARSAGSSPLSMMAFAFGAVFTVILSMQK